VGKKYHLSSVLLLLAIYAVGCSGADLQTSNDDGDSSTATYRITEVLVENHNTYQLVNDTYPLSTGDLWPCAWGDDNRLYTANGDGVGFGLTPSDIVFDIVDGEPPHLAGSSPPEAFGNNLAGLWGDSTELSRKPTGLTCVDGNLYLFFQNLKTPQSDNPYGDAPYASISVSYDHGLTWEYDASAPMFADHIFTTGFFLDYGKCQENAIDDYVYVYGLDYNWRYADGFDQTKMFLARVNRERIMERPAWEFFAGSETDGPAWSPDIDQKVPVLEDDHIYADGKSGISQGSVIYIPQLDRYLYSTRAWTIWIFHEAEHPWGPWTKVSVVSWNPDWTAGYHPGYPVIIPTKFLDDDGLGGWIVSSMPRGRLDDLFYNMGFRRFWLTVAKKFTEAQP